MIHQNAPELKQETYYIEGKGWRTHHVISKTSSFEREATPEEIEKATGNAEPDEPKKRGRAKKES